MKHTPYSSYQPSGVGWLDDLPEHWESRRLKFLASTNDESLSEAEDPLRAITYVDIGSVDSSAGITNTEDMVFEDAPSRARRLVRDGDTIISTVRTYLRAIAPVCNPSPEMVVSTGFAVIRPQELDSGYATWALREHGFVEEIVARSTGVSYPAISASQIGNLSMPLPPHSEQRTIAAFLDHETAKVDALITKKQQLIDRLSEYRTALVAWTVTKGLPPDIAQAKGFIDPSPRLKPTGAEWLGDVPEHWEVVENRRVFRERDERSVDGEGELLTVSHITGVTRRSEKPDVGMFMAESLEDYKRCYAGDFVINTMWAWMGAAGTAKEPGLVSPSYNVYVPDHRKLLPRFVDLAYRSSRYVLGMTSESRGIWSSRLRLYPQHFLSLVTAAPPLREQEAIIAHVDAIEMRLERLSEMVCTAIERLQEYRSALITAAVTGKIDVRDYAPVETEGSAA